MERIYMILTDLRSEFDFHSSKDFIADGMLDSFDIISLVTELEENFEILIDALDIVPENFCSVEAIANVVSKNGGTV
jgi:acyl carrier protein